MIVVALALWARGGSPPGAEGPYILPNVMSRGTAWQADAAPVVGTVERWTSSASEVLCVAGTTWHALGRGTATLTAHGAAGSAWSHRVEVVDAGDPPLSLSISAPNYSMSRAPLRILAATLLLAGCTAAPVPSRDAPGPLPAAEEAAVSQPGLPATDVFLLSIERSGGELRLGAPVNATDRAGYDNQPSFTPDGRSVLYTSIREDGQADIYRYDLGARRTTRLTGTTESEYSPTVTPSGRSFSVIRVEADSTQRLWEFDLGGTHPRLVLSELRPVGYHAWIDANLLALFVLGTPPTLRIADRRTGRADVVAENVGRSIHRIPGGREVSFVHKVADGEWWVRALDPASGRVRPLIRTLPGSEDYAWTPDGVILMAQGSVLFRWDPARGGEWERAADLAPLGIGAVTRLAVSPRGDRLALVATR